MAELDGKEKISGMKRPPMSVWVWGVVFAVMIGMMVFRSSDSGNGQTAVWTQSQFETQLNSGNIQKAVFSASETRFFKVSGEVKPTSLASKGSPQTYASELFIDEELWSKIRQKVPDYRVDTSGSWIPTVLYSVILPLGLIMLVFFLIRRQMQNQGKGVMQFGRSRARVLMPGENKTKFDDVAGADEAKEEIKEIVDYLKDPLKFKLVGGRIPKGALLLGAPGTGKTLMAKAVAGEANVPFFALSGSDFEEMFVGVGASRVRDLFDQARSNAPCLIFIDEIDAVGRSRFNGIGSHSNGDQTLNAILVELDGLEENEGIIMLAATNRADVLDPALLRPGRFDRQIVMDLPDLKGREAILKVHLKKIRVDNSIDVTHIARSTPGFSGADLANLVNEAALQAARENRDRATKDDFEEARDKVSYGRERRSRQMTERERRLTAWHEAGHTLVAMLSADTLPVHKVTIIPRGQSFLGATMHLPKEDRYTQSRHEMEAHIRVCMGGRIAEELVFGDVSSGASGDISQATQMARAMVCRYGMSDILGLVRYDDPNDPMTRLMMKNEPFSEETSREIDLEVRKLVAKGYQDAKEILVENRARLDKLAETLLTEETMDAAAVRKLLDIPEDVSDDAERGSSVADNP